MKGGMPALFKHAIPWPHGGRVFDIGAGRPEMVESMRSWFEQKGVTYLPYDRFNGDAYNGETVQALAKQKADVATASNLLNVIPDPRNRIAVLQQMFNALKPGGRFYITVHRQSGKAPGESGKDKWQNHMKPAEYLAEIQQVFPNATAKGDLISGSKQ
jgi:SAM-dependent methyltransferase